MSKLFSCIGALGMALAVGLGAYGSHGLPHYLGTENVSYYVGIWKTAVEYQFIHCLGLLLLAALADKICHIAYRYASLLMIVGVVLFSGSLYALVFAKVTTLGVITPIGGMSFLIAWLLFAVGIIRKKS